MSLIAQGSTLGLIGKVRAYSPLFLGASLVFWFDAANAIESGQNIMEVTNAGSLATSLVFTKPSGRPTLVGNEGEKIISHDGVDDSLETLYAIEEMSSFTFYAIVAPNGAGTFVRLGGAGKRIYFNDGWFFGDSPTVQIGANHFDWQIIKNTVGSTGNGVWRVGADGDDVAPISAYWKTIIVINRQLTLAEESPLENWLAARL